MLCKRSRNKLQGVSPLVPEIYELNIRQNIFSDFSSPRLGARLMRGGGLYAGFYGIYKKDQMWQKSHSTGYAIKYEDSHCPETKPHDT